MPFCPSCHAEYEAGTTRCADCDVELVAALPDSGTTAAMTDVYLCFDAQHAERAAELLRERSVEVLVRDRSSTSFPFTVGTTAKRVLAVPAEQTALARSVLEAAVHDGVLPIDGEILPAPPAAPA
jgi:hypothetical protein